jgi:nucleotide-binding universal stress UspA family protein
MFDRILVSLDGSELSEQALPYATTLAERLGSRLHLVRVPDIRPHRDEELTAKQVDTSAEAESYLEAIAERLRQSVPSVSTQVPAGDPVDAIVGEAERSGADLIAIATHGRGGLGRLVYGSVAAGLLARSELPLLVVRSWVPPDQSLPGFPERPRILVPLDGSEVAEEALPVAKDLAGALGGELALVRAAIAHEFPIMPVPAAGAGSTAAGGLAVSAGASDAAGQVRAAEEYLAQVTPRGARSEVIMEGPARAIVDAAGYLEASLVVMTTHGRTGMRRALLGSVADGVLRQGSLPLLLIRPRSTREG